MTMQASPTSRLKAALSLAVIFNILALPLSLLFMMGVDSILLGALSQVVRAGAPVNLWRFFITCGPETPLLQNIGLHVSVSLCGALIGYGLNETPRFHLRYALVALGAFILTMVSFLLFAFLLYMSSPCDFSGSQCCS